MNQEIPVLCASILQLKCRTLFSSFREFLQEHSSRVHLVNCGITVIEPGYYIIAGILGYLKISRNRIRILRTGVFNEFAVRSLELSYNGLEVIESGAFENNTYMEYLILKGNVLIDLNSNWFKSVARLRSVNVAENRLVRVKKGCFRHLMDRRISINLAYNEIEVVDEGVFSGFYKIDSLLLQCNNLSSLPDDFFKNNTFYILHLGSNQLSKLPESFYSCDRDCNNIYLYNNKFLCNNFTEIEKYGRNSSNCQSFKATTVFFNGCTTKLRDSSSFN